MSDPQPPEKVKLVTSLFSGDAKIIEKVLGLLSKRYGLIDYISSPLSFSYTDYYEREFGSPLIRRFAAFERLITPETLPDIKLWTNRLEKNLSSEGKRSVNIDPGYLSTAHLILATGKGYSHRPYLRDGIYADVTLMYQNREFHVLPWTYPDYAEKTTQEMLSRLREKYLLQLRGEEKKESGD
jgi:hypothetical protein